MDRPVMETARLRLRACRESDKAAFATILNTPPMTAQIGGVKARAEVDALIDKRIADQAGDGFSYWAVETRADGVLVGSCGLRRARNYPATPVADCHEVGWRIAETHWRKGFAREAAEATLGWAWANTDAAFVAAWTTTGNAASWRLMERLGMARRHDLDFRHPQRAAEDPQGALIVYAIDRPQ